MPDYDNYMREMGTKKRSVIYEDDDKMEHSNAIATKYLM